MQIPFVGQSYNSRDDKQETINFYPEVNTARKVAVMLGTPGLRLFASLGDEPMRGMHIMSIDESKLFVVVGKHFYRVAADDSSTLIGDIGTSQGLVSMADNGIEILIVDGSASGWLYTKATDSLAQIASPDFPGAKTCVFIDGYFIIDMIDDPIDARQGQRLMQSGLYDGTAWNPLDVAEAEGDPDPVVAISSNRKELWIHGRLSTEIWYDAANPVGFSFSRMQGGIVEYGLSAKWSRANVLGTSYGLARTDKGERAVVAVTGYSPNIVSSPGINYHIGQIPNINDAEAFCYTQEGHSFYVITFPSGDITFVYDASTGMWHRRKSYGMGRWRARGYAFYQGKHLVGDFQNGNIYQLDMDYYTENGDPIERVRVAPEMIDEKDDYRNIFVHEIQLNMNLGVGTEDMGQGYNPQAGMETSYDNGKTWKAKHLQPLMKQGEFKSRIMWHRWGKARRRLFRLTISDPVQVVIKGAWVDAKMGIS